MLFCFAQKYGNMANQQKKCAASQNAKYIVISYPKLPKKHSFGSKIICQVVGL
jgi:hypothetical protein